METDCQRFSAEKLQQITNLSKLSLEVTPVKKSEKKNSQEIIFFLLSGNRQELIHMNPDKNCHSTGQKK